MSSSVTLKQMLEMGVHFGHRTQKWNPKMAPYIFTQRNGIHILDLQQSLVNLNQYYDMVRDLVASGGTVLFVGTKRQAQETIEQEAEACNMPYVNHRWLGGTLTNWQTIRTRIETLKQLETQRDRGDFARLTKRERVMVERRIEKLRTRLGGISNMKRLPDMMVVVDTKREITAVKEANKLEIPILAMVDSNSDPDDIDYLIPANDDAMRSIRLIVGTVAQAIKDGQNMMPPEDTEGPTDYYTPGMDDMPDTDEDEDDEQYLTERTLSKLRDQDLFEEEDES